MSCAPAPYITQIWQGQQLQMGLWRPVDMRPCAGPSCSVTCFVRSRFASAVFFVEARNRACHRHRRFQKIPTQHNLACYIKARYGGSTIRRGYDDICFLLPSCELIRCLGKEGRTEASGCVRRRPRHIQSSGAKLTGPECQAQ